MVAIAYVHQEDVYQHSVNFKAPSCDRCTYFLLNKDEIVKKYRWCQECDCIHECGNHVKEEIVEFFETITNYVTNKKLIAKCSSLNFLVTFYIINHYFSVECIDQQETNHIMEICWLSRFPSMWPFLT